MILDPSEYRVFVDPYKLLGINLDASIASIRKAYLLLAKKYHPDKNPGDASAGRLFKQLSTAYHFLMNNERREQYDLRQVFLKQDKDGHLKVVEACPFLPLKPDILDQSDKITQSSLLAQGLGVYEPAPSDSVFTPYYASFFCMEFLIKLSGVEPPLKKRIMLALDATLAEVCMESSLMDKYERFINQWLKPFSVFYDKLNYMDNFEQLQQLFAYLSYPDIDKLNPIKKLFKLNLLCALLDCPINVHEYQKHLKELEEIWADYLTDPQRPVNTQ